ncbi:WD domain containing protein [Beauveria brongniartii RCEF 3172]|uniref:WD domain containing protein n=1 Tax=Beauveria brongniartii RCEF 3172 TaxID=1081107 RepID=A0A162JQR7_9HYPO|nr:WD domain containing protein [Beauveria brongniartii RCEF 3172]
MWFPGALAPPVREAYTEPVAILANNDCTVTVISLDDFDQSDKIVPLDIVTYPDYVNRATISPDGRIMAAILDDPYLYIHVRSEKSRESGCLPQHTWELRQRLMLKSQKKGDRADSRGSFAACFSNSGSYLAVGTQHGVISIYDAELLLDTDTDPLLTTFESSRPRSGPGAIRDMAFCPGPFDILAWTEDRGHIGIADVRANFIVRQIVDISAEPDFEHISIFDRNTIDPRLLDGQNTSRREGNQLVRVGLSATRRQGDGRIDTLNQPLTPSETIVLEAIQGDRRRRDRITQRTDGGDTTMTDSSWSYLASLRSSSTEEEVARPLQRQRSSSVTRGSSETSNSYRDQRERERLTDRVRNIRQLARDPSDRLSGRRDQRWIDRLGETVAAMREQRERDGDRPDASYLNVLDILQARERSGLSAGTTSTTSTATGTAIGTGTGSSLRPATTAASTLANDPERDDSSLLVPLVNQVVNRWEESAIRGTLVTEHAGLFEVPPSPDNTAGLAWSDDGRTLFVGAQNGIYEFHINTWSRLYFPSMQMR